MYETDSQERVTTAILEKQTGEITTKLTENQLSVIIELELGQKNAAYTADEARELSAAINNHAFQRWTDTPEELIEHIRTLANVVDRKTDPTGVEIEQAFELPE